MINAKEQWLGVYQRESATTLKVMRAYPAAKHDLQPHPVSATAKKLMWVFSIEQSVIEGAVDGTLTFTPAVESLRTNEYAGSRFVLVTGIFT